MDHRALYISHATIPSLDQHDCGPFEIALKYEDAIVVSVCFLHELPEGVTLLAPYDTMGNSLARVPLSLVTKFHDDKEAEDIMRCIDADAQLLAYARG